MLPIKKYLKKFQLKIKSSCITSHIFAMKIIIKKCFVIKVLPIKAKFLIKVLYIKAKVINFNQLEIVYHCK
jgi:hypothetical protein